MLPSSHITEPRRRLTNDKDSRQYILEAKKLVRVLLVALIELYKIQSHATKVESFVPTGSLFILFTLWVALVLLWLPLCLIDATVQNYQQRKGLKVIIATKRFAIVIVILVRHAYLRFVLRLVHTYDASINILSTSISSKHKKSTCEPGRRLCLCRPGAHVLFLMLMLASYVWTSL